MKKRQTYMLCCNCGYAVNKDTMYIKEYKNTAFCLCRGCAAELKRDLEHHLSRKAASE